MARKLPRLSLHVLHLPDRRKDPYPVAGVLGDQGGADIGVVMTEGYKRTDQHFGYWSVLFSSKHSPIEF